MTSNTPEDPSLHLKAIAHNNHAAFLVEAGNYVDAISILSAAHKCSKYGLDQQCIRQSHLPVTAISPLDAAFMLVSAPAAKCCTSSSSDSDDTDCSSIHRGAIQLPPCLSSDYYSRVMVSVAIIFNLALAHHLSALEQAGSSKSVILFRKALKFYEYSFNLVRTQHAKTSISLLLMATINNAGHIHMMLGEEKHAETCFQNLFSILTCLPGGYCYHGHGGHRPALEVFFRTTSQYLVRVGPSCSAAAA